MDFHHGGPKGDPAGGSVIRQSGHHQPKGIFDPVGNVHVGFRVGEGNGHVFFTSIQPTGGRWIGNNGSGGHGFVHQRGPQAVGRWLDFNLD